MIIVEQMLFLPTSNTKRSRFSIYNNKYIKKMATKYLLLYYAAIKAPKDNDSSIFSLSTISVYNYKNKRTNWNKNSLKTAAKSLPSYYAVTKKPNGSDSLILILLTESICSCKREYLNIKNKDNRQD